ncbi:type IV conjugative transfer system protein TraV [Salmonella enterica subsp. enterica]|nr:type IV conjugative transfer system protein TraV [Salmonella enterica subsp. enterica]
MKKWFFFGTMSLLAGCSAGLKDSFDCNATAQDSCMTMEDANPKAAQKTQTASPLAQQQGKTPSSAGLPALAPLATPVVPITTTAVKTVSSTSSTSTIRTSRMLSPTSTTSTASTALSQTLALDSEYASWADIGMAPPQRLPTTTARLWIAPWIDEHDNLYQPAVVSFVVKAGQWRVK